MRAFLWRVLLIYTDEYPAGSTTLSILSPTEGVVIFRIRLRSFHHVAITISIDSL